MEAALSALYDDSLCALGPAAQPGEGFGTVGTFAPFPEDSAAGGTINYGHYAPPPPEHSEAAAYGAGYPPHPGYGGYADGYAAGHHPGYPPPPGYPAYAHPGYPPPGYGPPPVAYAQHPGYAVAHAPQAVAGKGGDEGEGSSVTRLVWSAAEDALILSSVESLGPKWRKIAALLPNRSDDAVRNRWHRLCEAQKAAPSEADGGTGDPATNGVPPLGGDRSSVYKCSRCGLPKKQHVCKAPNTLSQSEQLRLKKEAALSSSEQVVSSNELRSAWTKIEDEIILNSVNEFGPKWVEIAARLPGRTEHAARNRFHRLSTRAGTEGLSHDVFGT